MTLLALLLFLLPLAYSPGPGNLFFAAHGAQFGWQHSLWALVGYHVATLAAALSVGGGVLLLTGPVLTRAMLWIGTAYVLWLAWKLWRASTAPRLRTQQRAGFWQGAALLALNPKAWAIMAALFAQFPGAGPRQIAFVAVVFTLNNAVAFAVWTGLGQTLLAGIRNPRHLRMLNQGFALLLATVALLMALS